MKHAFISVLTSLMLFFGPAQMPAQSDMASERPNILLKLNLLDPIGKLISYASPSFSGGWLDSPLYNGALEFEFPSRQSLQFGFGLRRVRMERGEPSNAYWRANSFKASFSYRKYWGKSTSLHAGWYVTPIASITAYSAYWFNYDMGGSSNGTAYTSGCGIGRQWVLGKHLACDIGWGLEMGIFRNSVDLPGVERGAFGQPYHGVGFLYGRNQVFWGRNYLTGRMNADLSIAWVF